MDIRTVESDSPLGDKLRRVLLAVMKSYDSSITQLGLTKESNASVPVLFTNLILMSLYTHRNLDPDDQRELFKQHGCQLLEHLEQIDLHLKEISDESRS